MKVRQLINRAYMQVGDTAQETYTPYQFLEYYNEGNQLLNSLAARYCPGLVTDTYTGTGTGELTLPKQAISILAVTADGKDVKGYQLQGLQVVVFNADKAQEIKVSYVSSASYKQFTDDSGYPAELESILVDYMVARILNLDVSGVTASMTSALQVLHDGSSDTNGYVIAKGYFDYDRPRIDYSD